MKLVALLLIAFCVADAQSTEMTNQDVIEMSKVGLSAGVIETKISSSRCRFDTSIEALARLKSAGVDDSVTAAMIKCSPALSPHEKPHVWIGANEEWIARSRSTTLAPTSSVASSSARTTVQTHSEYTDVTRELSDKCQGVVITNNPSDADYAVTVERYNAGHLLTQRNTFSIFRGRDGDLLLSGKTTWLKNAAADICKTVMQDSAANGAPAKRN